MMEPSVKQPCASGPVHCCGLPGLLSDKNVFQRIGLHLSGSHQCEVSTGGKARGEHMADLGDSHNLVAMICYIEAFQHYVAGLLPVRVQPKQCIHQAADLVNLCKNNKGSFLPAAVCPWPAISMTGCEASCVLPAIVILTSGRMTTAGSFSMTCQAWMDCALTAFVL